MKIPPFSNHLKDFLQSGQIPDNNVFMYIGIYAWDKGKSSSICRPSRTIVLPPSHSPLSYEWPVEKCDILIIETSQQTQQYIEDIVQTLFFYEANKVSLISYDFYLTTYKKDF